jgi:Tol biopolymer transport system component
MQWRILGVLVGVLASSMPGAAWAAKNGRIVYDQMSIDPGQPLTSSLMTMNPDGTRKSIILNNSLDVEELAWSSDGRRLAMTSDPGEESISMLDPVGSVLWSGLGDEAWGLAWSRDGSKLAYLDSDGGDRSDLALVNSDGTGNRYLFREDVSLTDGSPVWSEDGNRLFFSRSQYRQEPHSSSEGLFTINLDGSGLRRIRSSGYPLYLSPKGKTLFFADPGLDPQATSICAMRPDGTHVRCFSRHRGRELRWSPNGKRILFERDGDIFTMRADGTRVTQLTHGPALPPSPVAHPANSGAQWSPNGKRILFTSWRDGNYEAYVMNSDGTGQRNLSQSPSTDDVAKAWQPLP